VSDAGTTGAEPSDALLLLAEEVVLDLPAVEQLLLDAARAAAAGVGLSCGITYVARYGVLTVASSDERANGVDEIQYGADEGPCLEALRTRTVVQVEDQVTDTRWGAYRERAVAAGVRSSLSLPLIVDDRAAGALNVYSTQVGPLPADQEAGAMLAASQVTGVLQAVRRLAAGLLRDPDAVRDVQARHQLDIAVGILMAQHGCTDTDARTMLDEQAKARGMSISQLATELITAAGSPSGQD
jgi:GAF domain-containing protein